MTNRPLRIGRRAFLKATSGLALAVTAGLPEAKASEDSQDFVFLRNKSLEAAFDSQGLTSLDDLLTNQRISFADDGFIIQLASVKIDSAALPAPERSTDKNTVTYSYSSEQYTINVVYELQPEWRFVSKRCSLIANGPPHFHVQSLTPFRAEIGRPIGQELTNNGGRYGAFLRFSALKSPGQGLFLVVQNPFMEWTRSGQQVSVAYAPEMDWDGDWGPFISDRVCLGTYALSGYGFPAEQVPEWKDLPEDNVPGAPIRDLAETQALTECVRAFLLAPPAQNARIHVGWCENDYQIDITTPHGQDEYHRIMDQAAALQCEHILYGPTNPALATRDQSTDAWQWEYITWLGLGVQIREGKWDPDYDPIPESIAVMQKYADQHQLSLIAYVYPSLKWRPEWTAGTGPYAGANSANREFQDWLVQLLVDFHDKMGIAGYSFDYWWLDYPESSRYEQWNGCRWILETLRERLPDILIDGRQSYQEFGPWTWLAGSYPHPTTTDEQPESFPAFPDLHFDRVCGNRQRWAAWWYRMENFCPTEILPGFITHQTQRSSSSGQLVPLGDFRIRDWDYLGWKYSFVSSLATAPINNVVNMIPARDIDEFKFFSLTDQKWLQNWLDWAETNRDLLMTVRPIIGQPMFGQVDGTAAISEDHGFLFLFNPNQRAMQAAFSLDRTIGLSKGVTFTLQTMYPEPGALIGKPDEGVWSYGDTVTLPMEGASALILAIAASQPKTPALLNIPGEVTVDSKRVRVSNASGPFGHQVRLQVLLPQGEEIQELEINGISTPFQRSGNTLTALAQFGGSRFDHCQQIGGYDPGFTGGTWNGRFQIPLRVFDQLSRRKAAWPIPYTADDLLATWLGPSRLLLYLQIAEPQDTMPVTMKLNGRPIALNKAYTSIYPQAVQNTFVGWYYDASDLVPELIYEIELTLPDLPPGHFQGVFFENVETEMTKDLA